MSQGLLCPNLSQKVQKEVSQMANRNLSPVILLGGLSVNLSHLKTNKASAVAKINERQYVATLQEIPIKSLTRNENPLKKLERIDKPLTIKQDQEEKQVVNTIREVPPEMYTPAHLLIPPQDKLSLFRKHIPKQQEIDALLKNLRK